MCGSEYGLCPQCNSLICPGMGTIVGNFLRKVKSVSGTVLSTVGKLTGMTVLTTVGNVISSVGASISNVAAGAAHVNTGVNTSAVSASVTKLNTGGNTTTTVTTTGNAKNVFLWIVAIIAGIFTVKKLLK